MTQPLPLGPLRPHRLINSHGLRDRSCRPTTLPELETPAPLESRKRHARLFRAELRHRSEFHKNRLRWHLEPTDARRRNRRHGWRRSNRPPILALRLKWTQSPSRCRHCLVSAHIITWLSRASPQSRSRLLAPLFPLRRPAQSTKPLSNGSTRSDSSIPGSCIGSCSHHVEERAELALAKAGATASASNNARNRPAQHQSPDYHRRWPDLTTICLRAATNTSLRGSSIPQSVKQPSIMFCFVYNP
jgi:hypothetical protein